MNARKGNSNIAIANNQESDKVIIDGLMTAEDLVSYGTQAGINTIEQLRKMYPHNPELEARELSIIDEGALAEKLRAYGKDNDEKIQAFYSNQKLQTKIKETKDKIAKLNEEYKRTHENNLLYEKERYINELENKLKELQSK